MMLEREIRNCRIISLNCQFLLYSPGLLFAFKTQTTEADVCYSCEVLRPLRSTRLLRLCIGGSSDDVLIEP